MEVSTTLADRVLRLVSSPEYRPSKPKQIAAQLGAGPEDYREIKRVVKALVHRGQLTYGSNHLVLPPTSAISDAASKRHEGPRHEGPRHEGPRHEGPRPAEPRDVTSVAPPRESPEARHKTVHGTFRRAIAGFGFVRPGDGSSLGEAGEDIFIPPGATGGALDGDTVEIRLRPRGQSRGGTLEGYVDKVLQRGRRQFTGTVELRNAIAWVHLDGVPYDVPIEVGDVRGLPVANDDKVVVEMVEFPGEDGSGGEGVLLEVLGKTTNPAIDTLTIMRQYALPEQFPEEVLAEARAQANSFAEETVATDCRDLTDLLTVTIDPFDARDFDDAISLQKTARGWTLWVHIADVSSFVPLGGALDQEAERRATSVYLPDRVIPMIPEVISNHLASLQPGKIRRTKTVELELRDDGVVTSVEVYNAAIRSDFRFHYEQIDAFLDAPDAKRSSWGEPICDLLQQMHFLAMHLRRRRFKRGSLTLEVPEVKIDLDKNGKVKGAHVVAYTESHQIIEEFMLAANQAVATWLDDQELNFLHRIHPPPDRRKLRQLEQFVKDLRLPVTAVQSRQDIQQVLDLVAGSALENAVNFAVLKSLSKAIYAPHREGHYALNMQHYCHFTSPIRRYPDLTIHRLVQNLIDGKKTPDESLAVLLRLGFHCSDQERNAAQAERELVQLKLLHYMKKQLGQTLPVIINRVFDDGLLVRGVDIPIDGYLPLRSLPADKYRFERRGQMLVGFRQGNQFRLGDELLVRVGKVDLRERQMVFEFVEHVSFSKINFGSERKEKSAKREKKTKNKLSRKDKKKLKKSKR